MRRFRPRQGITGLLNPTSLLYALNPENFVDEVAPDDTPTPPTDPTDPATTDPTATPSPTPSPGEPTLPTLAELTEWPYTTSGIVWPDDDTVRAADLPVFTASGATTTILSSSNVTTKTGYTPGAAATANDTSVLVSDAAASASLRRAATAISSEEQLDALAELAAPAHGDRVRGGRPGTHAHAHPGPGLASDRLATQRGDHLTHGHPDGDELGAQRGDDRKTCRRHRHRSATVDGADRARQAPPHPRGQPRRSSRPCSTIPPCSRDGNARKSSLSSPYPGASNSEGWTDAVAAHDSTTTRPWTPLPSPRRVRSSW